TDHKDGQHFIDRHRTALIQRVNDTGPILDELMDWGLISSENYESVRALKTTQDQMRAILKPVSAARMKHLRPLISELEGSG
uniref:CARD domain-containing protein n=1 Tax=Lates calcarifer TaxID=8187 RepID=A0A4W6FA17_LATCA